MSEQDMSGRQGGQGMRGPGSGPAAEGQYGPDMGQAQGGTGMPGGGAGSAAMGQGTPFTPPFMPPPYYMGPQAMPYWWPPMPGYAPAMGPPAGQPAGGRQSMAQVMEEIANGGSGLSGLAKLLDFEDKDFWKGALVGAAAVLLLTNENIQKTLFRGAVKSGHAVQEGVEKVKAGADKLKQAARDAKAKADE